MANTLGRMLYEMPERHDDKGRLLCISCDNFVPSSRLRVGKRTCSAACWYKGMDKLREEIRKKKEEKKKVVEVIPCPQCGTEFTRSYYQKMRRYCSDACRMITYLNKKKEGNAKVVEKVIGVCFTCDAEFEQPKTGPRKKFCSDSCRISAWRDMQGRLNMQEVE